MKRNKKTVLVTGGAGFIGSHLCERLTALGYRVICLDNFNDFYEPKIKKDNIKNLLKNPNFILINGDILDNALLEKIFSKNSILKIFHLAALAGVRVSLLSPQRYIDVDIKGTVNLLEMAKKYKIPQFIFASSSSVYGARSRVPFRESDNDLTPISPYSASKLAGEFFCRTYAALYKIPIIIVRIFTAFGPRQRPEMAIHKFTRHIKQKKAIPMFAKGKSSRDYTYVGDIVEGIIKAASKKFLFEIFNLGNSRTTALKDLIKMLGEKLGRKPKINVFSDQPGDVPITYADISRAKRLLGWAPKVSMEEGIDRFIAWHNEKEAFLNKLNL